jgi:hypothetical protein
LQQVACKAMSSGAGTARFSGSWVENGTKRRIFAIGSRVYRLTS